MSEKVPQQEQALLRSHSIVNMDFQPIEIAGQWVGNIPCHHMNAVEGLQTLLNPSGILVERNFHRSIIGGLGEFPWGPNLHGFLMSLGSKAGPMTGRFRLIFWRETVPESS